jgi:aromatic-L-amino-acid decarboxylase
VEKGVRIAGLGSNNLRVIEVDGQYAMRPDRLAEAMVADRAAGLRPCFACATVGTTSSTAIDPLREIGGICRQQGVWLHVDAALAGTAGLCPEFHYLFDGLELADSYCFNPHKWMFTNFDCNCFFVAERAQLIRTLSILPEYLRNQATESGAVIDYRDWQVPLGRRFRALKLWFVLRSFGVEGLRARIRQHVELAQEFAGWVRKDDRFELAAPSLLGLVCFRHRDGDAVNQEILDGLNASGRLLLTHTRLNGKLTLRFSIGQTNTQRRHVETAWKLIQEAAAATSQHVRLDEKSAPRPSIGQTNARGAASKEHGN